MEESLSTAASTPKTGQGAKTKLNSCSSCQQRKVKCDKRQPTCSNCGKHRATCIYVAPPKSQRRKKKSREEELMARLKRYESLVQAHGIPLDDRDLTLTATHDDSELEPPKTLRHKEPARKEPPSSPENENGNCHRSIKSSGKFIIDGGKQSFVESPLWNSLSEELQGPVDMSRLYQTSGQDSYLLPAFLNAGDLVLNSTATDSAVNLLALHPNSLLIFRLWQLFLDNVNPLIKLLHAPTIQRRLLDTISHLDNISKEWEALMFAIYLLAIQSITANECQLIMGESKSTLVRRYHSAVRSALLRANFTSSIDLLLVQALTLYLLAVRQYYEPNAFWILTGTAVRLGQRVGLHRDGTSIGLSPFETEIRRRVWWRLMSLDGQSAELCGAGFSVTSLQYDSKMPLNINDTDLSPDMSTLPPEHKGPTEMIFCGARNEIGLFLKNTKANGKWMEAGVNSIVENDSHLDELEALIKHKYLQICDPSIPLHLFTRITSEATIVALRLVARHPRKYPQGGIEMSSKERDKVFWLCMHVLDYYNLTMRTESIQRFLWNVNIQFQWHAFIILANELQLRPEDDYTRDAWSKIEELFKYNQDVIVNTNTPLHNAVSRLILKAWSKRQNRLQRRNIELPAPVFISTLQDQVAKQDAASRPTTSCVRSEQTATEISPASQLSTEPTFDTNDFLDALTPNMAADGAAIDWSDWDNMLQDFEFPNASFAQT